MLLSPGVTAGSALLQMLRSTEALFVNGFIFDELPGPVVMSAVDAARKAGAATFFDPGPRAWTLRQGGRKQALDALLDASDVVLMTQANPWSNLNFPHVYPTAHGSHLIYLAAFSILLSILPTACG